MILKQNLKKYMTKKLKELIDPDPEACFLILYQKYNNWLDFRQDIL
jgi:hypothetical protein